MLLTLVSSLGATLAFAPVPLDYKRSAPTTASTPTQLQIFDNLGVDKIFEESGALGKGITVGKVQIAIQVSGAERTSPSSIFSVLNKQARNNDDIDQYDDDYEDGYGDSQLSKMCHETCLALLRCSDNWIAACSDSEWFKESDAGKAESVYNLWGDREATKVSL